MTENRTKIGVEGPKSTIVFRHINDVKDFRIKSFSSILKIPEFYKVGCEVVECIESYNTDLN